MSRPHGPHRHFFPFGNLFRNLSSKASQLPRNLHSLLNTFEETLSERLQKLIPQNKADTCSLLWMKLAMALLSETHNDVKALITELELPVSDWDEKWIDTYLDISVKLLDICIALSSELSRLNQGNLLLQCVMHNLESRSPEQFMRARPSLDSWKQHISRKNPRLETCLPVLRSLSGTANLPNKVKGSAKGKVLTRAMYGVKVVTVYICGVFAAGLSGSSKNLLEDISAADSLLWVKSFGDVQTALNLGIRDISISSGGKSPVLKELGTVDSCVEKLCPWMQDGVGCMEVEAFKSSVTDFGKGVERFSEALDLLSKEVDGFFKIVLCGRDALLANLRAESAR